jgi:hypothetical protein
MDDKPKEEQPQRYIAVRCDCGWPIFRIHKDGLYIKHHSCDYVMAFPWAMIDTWKAQGSALQGR